MLTWSFFFKELKPLYSNLKLIGKILFFPFILLCILSYLIMGLFEFIIVDTWILLWEILSKNGDVKGMINSMLDIN
jgi:hypothetical protein